MISREELALIMNDCLISDDPLEALINRVDFQLEALIEVGVCLDECLSKASEFDIKYKDLLPLMDGLMVARDSLRRVINIDDWRTCECCDKPRHRSQYRDFKSESFCISCESEIESDIEDGIDEAAS
jgi:hypothetical protein